MKEYMECVYMFMCETKRVSDYPYAMLSGHFVIQYARPALHSLEFAIRTLSLGMVCMSTAIKAIKNQKILADICNGFWFTI